MEMQKYALEGILKLRHIALVEIVLGCLAVAVDISNLFHGKPGIAVYETAISLSLAVHLLAAGGYGLVIVQRSRAGELISPFTFRTLATLNMILCAMYCYSLGMLIPLSFLVLVCIDATLIVFLVIQLLCIGTTIMTFKISRHNAAITESSGMKTKEVEAEYQTPPPPYTTMCEASKN